MKRVTIYSSRVLVVAIGVLLALGTSGAFAQEGGDPAQEDRAKRMRGMRERMMKDDGAPKVGDVAPTFALKTLEGEEVVDLGAFKGDKPAVLIFGSYT